jgi:hypothetical protein
MLVVLGACRSGGGGGSTAPAPVLPGAVSARRAAEQFLASIKAEDVQATSIIWGSAKGPARELIRDRSELEKRILVMQCSINHDSYRILSDLPGDGTKRQLKVELKKGQLTAVTTMTATPGPNDRWFVENTDLNALRGFCSSNAPEQKR